MKATKVGRRASPDERKRAQKLVDLYREAIANGGSLVVNPEDPWEEQTTFYADLKGLLRELEGFARTGTFANEFDFMPLTATTIYNSYPGLSQEERLIAVAEEMHISPSTAARLVGKKR